MIVSNLIGKVAAVLARKHTETVQYIGKRYEDSIKTTRNKSFGSISSFLMNSAKYKLIY